MPATKIDYSLPFSVLKRSSQLKSVHVDEGWSLNRRLNVVPAVAAGAIQPPYSNDLEFGCQEARLPMAIQGTQIALDQSKREES